MSLRFTFTLMVALSIGAAARPGLADVTADDPAPGTLQLGQSTAVQVPPVQEGIPLGVPAGGFDTGAGEGTSRLQSAVAPYREAGRVVGALAVVLGLLVILRLAIRRLGGTLGAAGRPSGVVEVMARYPVARGQQLVVLKLGRRVVLLHQSKSEMTTLSEVSEPDEVASLLARIEAGERAADGRFPKLLKRLVADDRADADRFPPTPEGVDSADGNVVIDLTRRSSRGLLARGGAR